MRRPSRWPPVAPRANHRSRARAPPLRPRDLTFAMALLNPASLDLRGWAFLAELREHPARPRGLLGALRALGPPRRRRGPLRVVVPTAAREYSRRVPRSPHLDGVRLVAPPPWAAPCAPSRRASRGATPRPGPDDGAGRTPFSRGALRRASSRRRGDGRTSSSTTRAPETGRPSRTLAALLPAHDEDTARALRRPSTSRPLRPAGPPGAALSRRASAPMTRGKRHAPGPSPSHRGPHGGGASRPSLRDAQRAPPGALDAGRGHRRAAVRARGRTDGLRRGSGVHLGARVGPTGAAVGGLDGLPRGCLRVDLSRELQPAGDDDAPMTLAAARYVVETVRRAYGYRMASPPLRHARRRPLRARAPRARRPRVRPRLRPAGLSSEAAALTPERPS